MNRQSEDVRTFLCRTSIFSRLCAPLCDAVTGRNDSRTILSQLEQANLFVTPLDDQREWFRYHHLFADFLRTEINAAEISGLHTRAACWLEADGLVTEAIGHAMASRDLSPAARLIGKAATEAFDRGELVTLLGWIDALPEALSLENIRLAVYKAWALFVTGQIESSASYLAGLEHRCSHDIDPLTRGMCLSQGLAFKHSG